MSNRNVLLLNVRQAASRLNVSVSSLRRWIREGRIAIVKLGRAVRIPEGELLRLIEQGLLPAANRFKRGLRTQSVEGRVVTPA